MRIAAMTKITGVALAVLTLTACAPMAVKDETSPYSRIQKGSTIVLEQSLPIPSGATRVFLQDGQVSRSGGVNIYYPHCNFEVRTLSDGSGRIQPDRFTVTGIQPGRVEVVREHQPFQLASLYLMVAGDDNATPPPISRLVHYRLESQMQPDVMRLTCHGGFADDWEADYPSVADIRQALSGVARLAN
jgi:hypothetical protein